MPELPEVQTIVNTLRPRIVGMKIQRLELRRADILHPVAFDLPAALNGRTVIDLSRRGKRLIFTLGDENRFYIHLGMSGRLTIDAPDAPIASHTHAIIHLPQFQVRFRDPRRFGGIWWVGCEACDDKMGPEPLTIRADQLHRRLLATRRPIKNALLDQHLIAGLGNIYVDESLFTAKIHPLVPANTLTREDAKHLARAIKLTLRKALRHRGSTLRDYVDADGGAGGFQNLHLVYDRAGEACRRCRAKIKRIVLGGRSTCFCPRCQRRTYKRDSG